MAQDYAKKRAAAHAGRRPVRAATRVTEEGPVTHWNWFFSGLFCGLLIVGVAYLGLVKLDSGREGQAAEASIAGEVSPGNRPVFDFGFYGELENAEIAVSSPPANAESAANSGTIDGRVQNESTAPTVVLTRYLLQAGSFQDRQDAENRRAKIILLNMDASIVPGVVSGRTWHRVQVGPFNGRAAADDARDLLSENNIDSIPLLVRD